MKEEKKNEIRGNLNERLEILRFSEAAKRYRKQQVALQPVKLRA